MFPYWLWLECLCSCWYHPCCYCFDYFWLTNVHASHEEIPLHVVWTMQWEDNTVWCCTQKSGHPWSLAVAGKMLVWCKDLAMGLVRPLCFVTWHGKRTRDYVWWVSSDESVACHQCLPIDDGESYVHDGDRVSLMRIICPWWESHVHDENHVFMMRIMCSWWESCVLMMSSVLDTCWWSQAAKQGWMRVDKTPSESTPSKLVENQRRFQDWSSRATKSHRRWWRWMPS